MAENIKYEHFKAQQCKAEWGYFADILKESSCNVLEYNLDIGKSFSFDFDKNTTIVVVSGAMELLFDEKPKVLFKGEKFTFDKESLSHSVKIANCGVIPLLFIKISL